jgi:hypothetical protein
MPKKDDYNPSVNYGKLNEDTTWGHTPSPYDPRYFRSISERFIEDTTTTEKIGIAAIAALLLTGLKLAKSRKTRVSPLQLEILTNLEAHRRWDYNLSEVEGLAPRRAMAGLISSQCVGSPTQLTNKGRNVLYENR